MNLLDVCCTVIGYLQRSAAAVMKKKVRRSDRGQSFGLSPIQVSGAPSASSWYLFYHKKVIIICRLPAVIFVDSKQNKLFEEHDGK